MSEGFLSRWSRLKKRQGDDAANAESDSALATAKVSRDTPLVDPQVSGGVLEPAPGKFMPWAGVNPAYQKRPNDESSPGVLAPGGNSPVADPLAGAHESTSTPEVAEGTTSLPDIKNLNMESDFKPFMQANVPAESRNAALKKLFADPSFNVMDGLDTYIADYSQPDPIPAEMLKELLKSKAFCLFDDPVEGEEGEPAATLASEHGEVVAIPDPVAGAHFEANDACTLSAIDDSLEHRAEPLAEPLAEPQADLAKDIPGPRVAPPPVLEKEKQKGDLSA